MTDVQIIEQREVLGREFRIYGDFDNPLFLAKDVADWIEYAYKDKEKGTRNVNMMLQTVDDSEKVKNYISVVGGNNLATQNQHGGLRENTEFWFLTEDGLYEVLMQSRKPIAKEFKKEVKQILKTIRRHGLYATDELLENPDIAIAAFQALKDEREVRKALELKNKAQAQKITEDKPKVLFADAVTASDTSILVGDLAKLLKQNGYDTGQKRLFEQLRAEGYLMKSGSSKNMPTQKSMDKGLFEVKETTIANPDGSIVVKKTTKVTGIGQQYFINKYLSQ